MQPQVFSHEDETALARLSRSMETHLSSLGVARRPVVFACIGTDRSTGDALGPLVGQRLLRLGCPEEEVLGTLEAPLHALNLAERLQPRLNSRPDTLVIAIDAALGPLDRVGAVTLHTGGLRPGQGVGKELPSVGELALTATVNVQAGALDVQVLQSTRLWLVQALADFIGAASWWALRNTRREPAAAARLVEAAV